MPIRILIVDDHAVIRDGLRMILEIREELSVVGEAGDGRNSIAQAETLRPDVVIMDIAMPVLNGIEAAEVITTRLPDTRVIILSMHHTQEHVFRAFKAGARGYLLKESAGAEVVTAVQTVVNGRRYLGSGVDENAVAHVIQESDVCLSPLDSLSRREREILQLVVEGHTSMIIADHLAISPKSVETYRSRLMRKLSVTNIPSLVKYALSHGITPAE